MYVHYKAMLISTFVLTLLTVVKVYANDSVFVNNRAADEGGAVFVYTSKFNKHSLYLFQCH